MSQVATAWLLEEVLRQQACCYHWTVPLLLLQLLDSKPVSTVPSAWRLLQETQRSRN
jgi:hypothetical protein